ncbi:MAG TPA: CoA transferase [Dehalococcoidia bacterium]|nr:CoA transferase [Dehalococcoidia bacterium]
MSARPLEGIRVLDLTQVYAGPTCARILADLGAEVIKLEGLKRIDIVRNFIISDNNSADDYWNHAGYFQWRNAGKKSLTLDWSDPEAIELLRRLVPMCDVVAESFTPHVMEAHGLGYEGLKALREDIIMISLSGYGQNGPWRDYSGYGMGLEPASGMSSITGYPGGAPLRTGISFTDPYSGIVGAGAVLAALHYRRRTGKGQYIDLSEQEAAIPVVGYALMDYAMNGRSPERTGNRSRWYAPQGCYRCSGDDNWLVITVRNDAEWDAFCGATGHPEWADDPRFAEVTGRVDNHDDLDALITSWTREQDHIQAMHLLQRAGVIAAAVLNPKQVLMDPHLRERGFFETVEHTDVGPRPMPRQLGARFSGFETDARGPAPMLGEHNHDVLQGLLGLSDAEVVALEERKIIGDTPDLALPLDVMRMFVQMPTTTYLSMGALAAIEPDYRKQLGLE